MATNFDSFDRSPLGAFYQSPLRARGIPPLVRSAALRGYQRNDQPYGTFFSDLPGQDFFPRVGKTWSTAGITRTKRYRIIGEFSSMATFPYAGGQLILQCFFTPPVVTTLEPFVLNFFLATHAADFYNSSTLIGQIPSSSIVVGNNNVGVNDAILAGMAGQPSLFLLLATDIEMAGAGADAFAARRSSMLGKEDSMIGFAVTLASA